MDQAEFNEIADGMEQVNRQMVADTEKAAPRCHFRPMFLDMSDSTDGYYELWWECSVCGHTKDVNY
jgi:hypothetical protein